MLDIKDKCMSFLKPNLKGWGEPRELLRAASMTTPFLKCVERRALGLREEEAESCLEGRVFTWPV